MKKNENIIPQIIMTVLHWLKIRTRQVPIPYPWWLLMHNASHPWMLLSLHSTKSSGDKLGDVLCNCYSLKVKLTIFLFFFNFLFFRLMNGY